MSVPVRADIAAVVVLYNPGDGLLANIESYAAQVDRVIAVDNSDHPDEALKAGLVSHGVEYVPMGGNSGIAAALNAGCRRAVELGYSWALTMDQDSTATPGLVATLAEEVADADEVAIVAPSWHQVDGDPVPAGAPTRDLDYAMTSGNLLRLGAFELIDGFREDLFIDHVDNEFCLRLRNAGFRIVQRPDAVLLHRMGHVRPVRFIVPFYVMDYSPVRRYYMIRNLFELAHEFGGEYPAWLADEKRHWRKELVKIVFFEPHRLQKIRMMYRGWRDYREHRFGRYDVLHSS